MGLAEILRDAPYNPNSTRHLIDEIRWAMEPFHTRDVCVWVDDAYEPGIWKVVIQVRTLPGYEFKHLIDRGEMLSMYYPEHMAREIGREAGKYFAAIRVEPDANIELGEN